MSKSKDSLTGIARPMIALPLGEMVFIKHSDTSVPNWWMFKVNTLNLRDDGVQEYPHLEAFHSSFHFLCSHRYCFAFTTLTDASELINCYDGGITASVPFQQKTNEAMDAFADLSFLFTGV